MRVEYYSEDKNKEDTRFKKFLKKDLQKRKDLKILVESFIVKVTDSKTLDPFLATEEISSLELIRTREGKEETRLHEMRIPKARKGGVVRIYFIQSKYNSSCILLLDGEVKHGKQSAIKDFMKNLTWSIDY